MDANLFNSSLRNNCIGEFIDKDGDIVELYVQFNGSKNCMEIGIPCIGVKMFPLFSVEYDNDFTLDWNLQNLLDPIYSAGYSDL